MDKGGRFPKLLAISAKICTCNTVLMSSITVVSVRGASYYCSSRYYSPLWHFVGVRRAPFLRWLYPFRGFCS